jgi:nucleotide-binding universal stress UspA family protein
MNLAVLTHAEILLLHAVEHSGDVIEPVTDEEIQYRQRAYKEVLDTFIQEGLRHGVTIQSVTQEGNPVQAILDTATMKNADMIVLGTQGRRGAEKVLLGSVSSGVMAGASIPVTLIR